MIHPFRCLLRFPTYLLIDFLKMASLCSSSPAIQNISESHSRSWLGKVKDTNVSTMILRPVRNRTKISWRIRGRFEGFQIRWSRKGKTKPNQTKPTFIFFYFKPKHQKLPTWNASAEDEEQISEGRGSPTEHERRDCLELFTGTFHGSLFRGHSQPLAKAINDSVLCCHGKR